MAIVTFSLCMYKQPNHELDYQIKIKFVADNPNQSCDGDDYFDEIPLLATTLVRRNDFYTVSDAATEDIRQQVLPILIELAQVGWNTDYEQRYFQQLSVLDNKRWHLNTLWSSHIFMSIPLFHPGKPAYSLDTNVRLFEWMCQTLDKHSGMM